MKAHRVKGLDPAGPLADNAQRIVAVRLDELCSFAPRVFDQGETEALHDMRIAAKRLRYVLELAEGLFGPYAREARKRARELQDVLGEIHDCDVLGPRIGALLEELRDEDATAVLARAGDLRDLHDLLDPQLAATAPNADAYHGLELLLVHLRARRTQLFERFLGYWTLLERDGFRARLEYAIAERPATAATTP